MSELRHFLGTGQTIEIVLDGNATAGELALLTLRLPPGAEAPPHRHTLESETLVVREGTLAVQLEGERRVLTAGEAVHLPRGALHSFVSEEGAVVDGLAVPAAPAPEPAGVAAALERHGLDFSGT